MLSLLVRPGSGFVSVLLLLLLYVVFCRGKAFCNCCWLLTRWSKSTKNGVTERLVLRQGCILHCAFHSGRTLHIGVTEAWRMGEFVCARLNHQLVAVSGWFRKIAQVFRVLDAKAVGRYVAKVNLSIVMGMCMQYDAARMKMMALMMMMMAHIIPPGSIMSSKHVRR